MDKKIARQVATTLNTRNVGGKKRNRWYEELWNMKYLTKFKWGHLNERLAYERAVHNQRLRTEVAQAKREANHYVQNVEKRKILARKEKKQKIETRDWTFDQKQTEDELVANKRKRQQGTKESKKRKPDKKSSDKLAADSSFLQTLFSGGLKEDSS